MPGKPGSGGPPPKRSDQRRRRNTDVMPVTTAPSGANPGQMPLPDDAWHPRAHEWFVSLGQSGQSRFYEPSDWAMAKFAADLMSKLAISDKPSAQMVASLLQITTGLMVTEGDRRRLRLELARGPEVDTDEESSVANIADYMNRVGG